MPGSVWKKDDGALEKLEWIGVLDIDWLDESVIVDINAETNVGWEEDAGAMFGLFDCTAAAASPFSDVVSELQQLQTSATFALSTKKNLKSWLNSHTLIIPEKSLSWRVNSTEKYNEKMSQKWTGLIIR